MGLKKQVKHRGSNLGPLARNSYGMDNGHGQWSMVVLSADSIECPGQAPGEARIISRCCRTETSIQPPTAPSRHTSSLQHGEWRHGDPGPGHPSPGRSTAGNTIFRTSLAEKYPRIKFHFWLLHQSNLTTSWCVMSMKLDGNAS